MSEIPRSKQKKVKRFERDRTQLLGRSSPETPLKLLLRLGFPVILLNLTFVVMQVTDAWLLSRLGSLELAAVTRPSMVTFLVVSFGYGLLGAVITTASNSYGRKEFFRCGQIAWLGSLIGLGVGLASLLLWPIGWLFFHLPGSSAVLAQLESQYFRISLLSLTPVLVTNVIANFFFAIRRTKAVLAAAVFGMALNALVSYGLIFGEFGAPELGFAGAAWGTVISSFVECLLIIGVFLWMTESRFRTKSLPKNFKGIRKLLKLGLPAGGQAALDVLSWGVLLSVLIGSCGEHHLAAAAVLIRCMQFTFLPAEGLATILITLVGSSQGKGRPVHARTYVGLAFRIIAIYMSACGLLFFLFRRPLMEAFSTHPEVVAIGVAAMGFIAAAQLFDAMNITYLHALQGAGDTYWPWKTNLVLSSAVLLGGGVLARLLFPDSGSVAVWFVVLIYIACQGLLFHWRWRKGSWREIDTRA